MRPAIGGAARDRDLLSGGRPRNAGDVDDGPIGNRIGRSRSRDSLAFSPEIFSVLRFLSHRKYFGPVGTLNYQPPGGIWQAKW